MVVASLIRLRKKIYSKSKSGGTIDANKDGKYEMCGSWPYPHARPFIARFRDYPLALSGEAGATFPRQCDRHRRRLDPDACGERTCDPSETGEVDPGMVPGFFFTRELSSAPVWQHRQLVGV